MKKFLTTATLTFGAAAFPATAETVADKVLAALLAEGFQKIEIQTINGQVEVEASKGGRVLEAVYDSRTGAILSQEVSIDTEEDEDIARDAREAAEEEAEDARDRAEDEADEQRDREEDARDRAEDEADEQRDREEDARDRAEDEAEERREREEDKDDD